MKYSGIELHLNKIRTQDLCQNQPCTAQVRREKESQKQAPSVGRLGDTGLVKNKPIQAKLHVHTSLYKPACHIIIIIYTMLCQKHKSTDLDNLHLK